MGERPLGQDIDKCFFDSSAKTSLNQNPSDSTQPCYMVLGQLGANVRSPWDLRCLLNTVVTFGVLPW